MKSKKESAEEFLKRTNCAIWEIDGQFYPVQNLVEGQVTDIGGRDAPAQRSTSWFANATESGVKYVASGSPTRAAALARIRRAFSEN